MVTLSPQQVAFYHEQGYLILRAHEHDLIAPVELKKWTDEVASWPAERGKWMPYNEINSAGETQLMRTENFANYHSGFQKLLFGQGITGLLQQLSSDVGSL